MNRRLHDVRTDESGAALIMVIGWMLVLATMVTAAIGYAIQTNFVAQRGQDWGGAQAAAMAGIEDYVARLNRNDAYGRTWDCANPALKGPKQTGNTCGWNTATTTGWLPVNGSVPSGPSFHYDVDASQLDANGGITVTATGRTGNVTRTVEAVIGRGGSTDFLYYTDLEHADPANATVYPTAPTKYFCGKNGAQKDIYWWSPKISGEDRNNSGCTEIGFAAGDVLNGRVHFNDTPKLNASGARFVNGFETSNPGCKTATPPNYYGCLRSSSYAPVYGTPAKAGPPATPAIVVPPVWADTLYLDDTSAKFATYPGCHYYGSTRIIFLGNGQMKVWSKDSTGKSTGAGCGTFTAANAPQTVNVPNEQVIYVSSGSAAHRCLSGEIGGNVGQTLPLGTYTGSNTVTYTYDQTMLLNDQFCGQGNLYIEGSVKGRVTMASENSIVVTGDLVLAGGINGTDLVGLVASNSVNVFHPWMDTWKKSGSTWGWENASFGVAGWPKRYPDPGNGNVNWPTTGVQISASIQTLQHSFFVQQYSKGSGEGTLLVQGSIAQRWRGIVGQGSAGYIKSYQYDSRLKFSSPPYFPQWTNAKWGPRHTGELSPRYNKAGQSIG